MEIFLKYLPYIMQAAGSIPSLLDFAKKMKANYEAKGEWTPEADVAFTQELANWHPEI